MRCVVTSFGSAGDFLPTLALGAALHHRRHDVLFVANPFYESRVRNAGLELIPAGEYHDLYQRLEQNPAYGKPANAGLLFKNLVGPNSAATHGVIGTLLRSEPIDVVIANDASLIIGHPSNMTFPSHTLAVRYAPYDQVFARAAAVVVHGGAGTTGEALRCGKPIIGVPFAFDQFGLCATLEQLGVGVRMPLAGRSRRDVARVLERVLSDASLQQRAIATASQFAEERDGAESGADIVESFHARSARLNI